MEGDENFISFEPIGWPEIRVHPRFLLSDEELTVARLWQMYRGGGMSLGPLPFAGGAADQPALVMEAFDVLSAAAEAIKPSE